MFPLWVWLSAAGVGVLGLLYAAFKMAAPDTDDQLPPDYGDTDNRR